MSIPREDKSYTTKNDMLDRATWAAKLVQIEGLMDRKPSELSGGMKQRLSLARALAADADLLLLDEPTLGLDVIARHDLWDVIRSLKGRITVVLTTHYMEEAQSLSDRIGIMKDGHLLAVGTAEELNRQAGTTSFEDAFVSIVKGESV